MSRIAALIVACFATAQPATADGVWSGTWRQTGSKQTELRTIDRGVDIEFQLEIWGGPPAYASGGMEGHLSINQGKAAYETTEFEGRCRIEFTFTPRRVVVKQVMGDWAACGFGHSIVADGTFVRVSRKNPKFVRH
jgi:hypothetical protein